MALKVTVFSDYICPFCYIGKARIDKLQKEFDLDVEWKGFEIHPETPSEGQTLEELGMSKDYIEMSKRNVENLAKDANLDLRKRQKISNSNLALRITEFAKERGKFNEFHNRIFRSYWQEGKNIGDFEILFDIIEEIGLYKDDLKRYLKSDKSKEKLDIYLKEVRDRGVTGVPTFIVGDTLVVGAQPYEELKKVTQKELAKRS